MTSNHFVVSLSFPRGAPDPEQRDAQKQFLANLLADGTLALAGQFTDERGGGMAILRADSLNDALTRYGKSPLVQNDIVDWEIREWNVTWGVSGQ